MTENVRPFSNGTQFMGWQASNCERCVKSVQVWDDTGHAWPTCEIEGALLEAMMFTGEVSEAIGERMGYTDPLRCNWPCNEVEWTEEWKAEYRKRHGKEETEL